QTAASGIGSALSGVHPKIDVEWNMPQLPELPFSGAASGGLVSSAGMQHFSRGTANVIPFQRFAMGTDTVPAMLTPGEMVLNDGQQKVVGRLLTKGGGRGSQGGGDVNVGGITINASGTFADTPGARQQLAEMVSKAIMD